MFEIHGPIRKLNYKNYIIIIIIENLTISSFFFNGLQFSKKKFLKIEIREISF